MNTMNEFDLQFKIFTLVDEDITKFYVIYLIKVLFSGVDIVLKRQMF